MVIQSRDNYEPDYLDSVLARKRDELAAARWGLPLPELKARAAGAPAARPWAEALKGPGIAVIADVVFNHAGGGFDDQCLYFLDRQAGPDNDRSLYFTRDGHAGGLVFAYWKQEVRQFLIDNGKMLLGEFHLDGLRYDQVTVMDEHGGWFFCQDLTNTLRFVKPASAAD